MSITLRDLIDQLEEFADEHGGEVEVRLAHQPRWSVADGFWRCASGRTALSSICTARTADLIEKKTKKADDEKGGA